MSEKEAGIEVQGTVEEALAGGMYRVKVDQGPTVLAYASGKMKKFHIRIIPGDRVKLELSPYDLNRGRNVYPFKIRKEPKRNIRVWLQDGSEDLENEHGSWPLQNLQMANSLKMMGYDFHLSFGNGTHNGAHGNAELPEEMTWLWRDYDPSRTEQKFEMEPAEKAKPLFRVKVYTRE